MDTWIIVAITVGGGVVIGVVLRLTWFITQNGISKKDFKPDIVPLVIRICEIVEVIIIACIIGNVVEKFAPRDEKVKEPLPVMTNGCFRVSGTLTVHVVEVEKHEPQQ